MRVERLCSRVLVIISRNKAKQDQSGSCFLFNYDVNDFLIDLMRRLKSPDRLDGNENSMFRRPLGLLEEIFSRPDS